MKQFKDLFSAQSVDYAKFRPRYPSELFKYLKGLVKSHDLAWDCATGNGQAAAALSPYFKKIVATDPSEKQISQAKKEKNIEYSLAAEENSKLADSSVDLVTVAQAFHWFNQEKFFTECERVLKPGGVLAIWSYGLSKVTESVDRIINHFYSETLNGYWEKERTMVDEGYSQVSLPFRKIQTPVFEIKAEWSLEQLLGYLGTWSAVQTFMKKNEKNPLAEIQLPLKEAWGHDSRKEIKWPLALLISQKSI